MIYTVRLEGRDAITEFLIDVYLSELHILERLRDSSEKASKYSCYPTLTFEEGNHLEKED